MPDRTPLDPEDDDAALSWDGDEALGRATSLTERAERRARLRDRSTGDQLDPDAPDEVGADGPGAEPDARAIDPAPGRAERDRPLLAITVVFGALYLAYEVAWILAIQGAGGALAANSGGAFENFLASVGNFLALLAAALWFVVTVQLTRGGRRIHRIGFLALGLGLLLPWPFLSGLVT